MRILMLGNSFTSTHHMPELLAELTGAEVEAHTRGGARLAEQLNPKTRLGNRTQEALRKQHWDYVVLQEMSNGPITAPERFYSSVEKLCGMIREYHAKPVLYATWAYQEGCDKLAALGMEYQEMAERMQMAYHQAAEQNHALIADVGKKFYDLAPERLLYGPDGVHPSERGAQLAAEVLASVILTDAEQSSSIN